jgi:hypothetical protein
MQGEMGATFVPSLIIIVSFALEQEPGHGALLLAELESGYASGSHNKPQF